MKKFRKQRRMLGLTQYELSRLTGIAPGRIVFAETGRTKLTDVELQQIKEALVKRAQEVATAVAAA